MADAYEKVVLARKKGRASGGDYIRALFTEFLELHGDRRYSDDSAVIGGIARLQGIPVTVIATHKGHSTKERLERNFGSANPEGYRKALRLMRQAEKFHRPIITFVDTPGAFCTVGAEERGQGEAIAESIMTMSALKTPIISVLIGEGGSGGALALAVADEVWITENSVYSVISPEGCASILWKDPKKVREAAQSLKLTAGDLKRLKAVERIFPERDDDFSELKKALLRKITELEKIDIAELLARRYERFRNF
ncbi:MAG: acetyl-CoA carboxylase carboxyl transferase subunit alpha [Clostridia bacterium]|nr:acetyl-CoA carboxylase carboxyl transferase subunit alpha [Clostridia bacterium]